jgi:hypothetical protein
MKEDQRKKLDEIDDELVAKLDGILTAQQIKSFGESSPSDAAELSKRPAGDYLAVFDRSTLEVTDAQRKELQALQAEFNPRIAAVLTDSQKIQIADFKKSQIAAAAGRGAPPKQGNTLFRATRYALSHPAFAGRTLTPGRTLVEIEEEFQAEKSKADAAAKATTAADAPR